MLPPFLVEHVLVHLLSILVWFSEGYDAILYNQCGYLCRWVGVFHIRDAEYFILHSDMGVTYPFHSPTILFGLTCHDPV